MKIRRLLVLSAILLLFGGRAFAFYNPTLGRWLTKDPMEEAGGTNVYGAMGNDPISMIDPTGLDFIAVGSGQAAWVPKVLGRHLSLTYWKESSLCPREGDRWTQKDGKWRNKNGVLLSYNPKVSKAIELDFKQFEGKRITLIAVSQFSTSTAITPVSFPISVIKFEDQQGGQDMFVVIYADTGPAAFAKSEWSKLNAAADSYIYASHAPQVDGVAATNWPNSMYGQLGLNGSGNNSNTFARFLASQIGKSADVFPTGYIHPGNNSPQPVSPNPSLTIPVYRDKLNK